MTYKQRMQWKELERILPILMNSLKKRKQMAKLGQCIICRKEDIAIRRRVLVKLKKRHRFLEEVTEGYYERYSLEKRIIKVSTEFKNFKKYLNKLEEEYKKLNEEIKVEELYYVYISEFLKNMKIGRKQITKQEFEALLYLLWITGTPSREIFDDVYHIYPELSSKLKKNYGGLTFYEAKFEEVFDIYL